MKSESWNTTKDDSLIVGTKNIIVTTEILIQKFPIIANFLVDKITVKSFLLKAYTQQPPNVFKCSENWRSYQVLIPSKLSHCFVTAANRSLLSAEFPFFSERLGFLHTKNIEQLERCQKWQKNIHNAQ